MTKQMQWTSHTEDHFLIKMNVMGSQKQKIQCCHKNTRYPLKWVVPTEHHHEVLSEEALLHIAEVTAKNNSWSAGSSFFVKTMHFALRSNSESPFPPQPPQLSPCVPGHHNRAFMPLPLPNNRCSRQGRQNNNCLYRLGRKAAALSSLTKREVIELL